MSMLSMPMRCNEYVHLSSSKSSACTAHKLTKAAILLAKLPARLRSGDLL